MNQNIKLLLIINNKKQTELQNYKIFKTYFKIHKYTNNEKFCNIYIYIKLSYHIKESISRFVFLLKFTIHIVKIIFYKDQKE